MFDTSGGVAQRKSAADCVSELNVLIDTLAGLDAGPGLGLGLGDGELVVDVTTAIRRLESVRAAAADRFHHSGDYTADGSRSSHAWIAGKVNEGWGRVGVWLRWAVGNENTRSWVRLSRPVTSPGNIYWN